MIQLANHRHRNDHIEKEADHPKLLLAVASAITASITLWRVRNESPALANAVRVMAQFDSPAEWTSDTLGQIFEHALHAILERLQDFLAVILRIESEDDKLSIAAKAADKSISGRAGKVWMSTLQNTLPASSISPDSIRA